MQTYKLTIPAPAPMLSANNRRHWAARAPMVKAWREAAYWWATKADLPIDCTEVEIHLELWFTTKRNRDRENYNDTLKPIVDGLTKSRRKGSVGYGLIHDDTPQYLRRSSVALATDLAQPPATAYGLAVVHIWDYTEDAA